MEIKVNNDILISKVEDLIKRYKREEITVHNFPLKLNNILRFGVHLNII